MPVNFRWGGGGGVSSGINHGNGPNNSLCYAWMTGGLTGNTGCPSVGI
jgi:hypothetical protein